jgi:hypothetical protein
MEHEYCMYSKLLSFFKNLAREAGTMALQDGEAKTGFLETKPGRVTFLYS